MCSYWIQINSYGLPLTFLSLLLECSKASCYCQKPYAYTYVCTFRGFQNTMTDFWSINLSTLTLNSKIRYNSKFRKVLHGTLKLTCAVYICMKILIFVHVYVTLIRTRSTWAQCTNFSHYTHSRLSSSIKLFLKLFDWHYYLGFIVIHMQLQLL